MITKIPQLIRCFIYGIPLWFTPQHDLAQPEIPIVEIDGGQPPSVVAVIGAGTARKRGGQLGCFSLGEPFEPGARGIG
jgi:hypothetical protein